MSSTEQCLSLPYGDGLDCTGTDINQLHYTDKERAALGWTEGLTNIQQGHAPEAVYQELSRRFSEAETVNLTLAITINAWSRIAIGFRLVPGSYQPAAVAH